MISKISVIIPCYQNFIFFERCISSVINQSYKNLEIIIIFDDGSKNDLRYLKSIIKKKQKKIRLIINSKNMGAGLSRNKAAKYAKGKYIAFLDSDDIWKRNKLKHQLAFMKKNKITISHTSYYIIDENNVKIGSQIAKHKQTYHDLLNSCDIGLSSLMIERNLFLKNKFTSNKTKEDYASWLKIAKKMPIYGLNKHLLFWRKTKNSLSSNIIQKVIDAFDIYYRKERFNFFNSTYKVIILSLNYFIKRLKQKL
tara:strand:+ start:4462 stop:5220 length:759 start_codon:yes stop_codon:yes gene_type:complete